MRKPARSKHRNNVEETVVQSGARASEKRHSAAVSKQDSVLSHGVFRLVMGSDVKLTLPHTAKTSLFLQSKLDYPRRRAANVLAQASARRSAISISSCGSLYGHHIYAMHSL